MKPGRNDPCPCGSGRKYKYCHLHRKNQSQMTEGQVRGMMSRRNIPSKCFHPDVEKGTCEGKIINSHTVSKSSTLRKVARGGHVYQYKPDINALFDNHGTLRCVPVGINQASTFPGFCKTHDKEMFAPIEDAPFATNSSNTFLLGYRALTKEIYAKKTSEAYIPDMRQLDRGRTVIEQVLIQQMLDVMKEGTELGLRDLLHHKKLYDKVYQSDDFSSSHYLVLRFSNIPNIVFSGAIYPEYDLAGNSLQKLGRGEDVLDLVAVNAIATQGGGAVVFHWLGDAATNTKLAKSIISVPDNEKASAITQFAFESFENMFISPDWWDSLDPASKEALEDRVQCGTSEQSHRPECLIPDGKTYFEWLDCEVEHNLDI